MKNKEAKNDYEIHELLKKRWSPRAFADKAVGKEKLQRIFEAARWSPSSMNEQPWRFIIGMKGDETYEKIYETLVEFNQLWTRFAPVLVLNVAKKTFTKNGNENDVNKYDTGQAVAHLSIQATEEGLFVHQMGGYSKKKAIELFDIPEDYEPASSMAIGYIGDPDILQENLKKSEIEERVRNSSRDFVFSGQFGKKSNLFDE